MALDGTTGYCACGSAGFRIVDFSNPANPVEISQLDLPGLESVVSLHNSLVYIGCVGTGLYVVDVANPAMPTVLSLLDFTNFNPVDMSYSEGHVIIADRYTANYDRLRVIDVTNPLYCQEVGYYNIGPTSYWWLNALAVSGNYAYVPIGWWLNVYDCTIALPVNPWETNLSHPSSFSLHPCSPNPFNPSTKLTYELPTASDVKLTVWNTAGQLVATLAESRQQPGIHTVTFDGTDLPNGIYFARLYTSSVYCSQKLVLLK